MLHLDNNSDRYFAATVDIYSSLERQEPWHINHKILSANTGLAGEIVSALEGMSNDAKIKEFQKATKDYADKLVASIKKHFELLKREVGLGNETIQPLRKVNDVFRAIYGEEKMQEIVMSTPVIYYKNTHHSVESTEGSYAFFLVERFSDSIMVSNEAIRNDLVSLLGAKPVTGGQIEMPKIDTQSSLPKTGVPLTELGYNFQTVSTGLERILHDGKQVTFSANNAFITGITATKENLDKNINAVNGLGNDFPDKVYAVERGIEDLQIRSTMLACILIIYHAVLVAAYNSAYTIHKAEIDFNKSQQNKR